MIFFQIRTFTVVAPVERINKFLHYIRLFVAETIFLAETVTKIGVRKTTIEIK